MADPELPREHNESLTQELREVVRAPRVQVQPDRPHVAQGERPHPHTALAYISMHRLQIVRALFIALTFGAVISLQLRGPVPLSAIAMCTALAFGAVVAFAFQH